MHFIAALLMLVFMILFMIGIVTLFGLLFYLTLQYIICPIFMWLDKHEIIYYILGWLIIIMALLQAFICCYHVVSTIGG